MLKGFCRAEGIIKNLNTIEDYRNMDKSAVLHRAGKTVCNTLQLKQSSLLNLRLDLGGHSRRHNLLLSFVTLVVLRYLVRRP